MKCTRSKQTARGEILTSCEGRRKVEDRRMREEKKETDCIMSKLFDAITKLLAKERENLKQQEGEREMNGKLKKEEKI